MVPDNQVLPLLRQHIAEVLLGPVFLFAGLAACAVAVLRHRRQSRLLVWFGLFIGLLGLRMLAAIVAAVPILPDSAWPERLVITVNYVLAIPSFLFWMELSTGTIRRLIQLFAVAASAIAIAGLGWYALAGSPYALLRYNLLIAIVATVVIGIVIGIPHFANKYFVLQSRVLIIVMPMIAMVTLVANVMWFLRIPPPRFVEPLAFMGWIAAIGYEAAQHTFKNERRLVSIESELETARQIQSSILPDKVPAIDGLRIAASYNPMSAVAGDFYQFVRRDDRHLGILLADVAGHGVPAALIASMIKVAMQSAIRVESEPPEVLYNLNQVLTPELKGRLTSAAYLWLDTEAHCACYSAAGHPPLLHWRARDQALAPIESNGLLFGVSPDAHYPVQSVMLTPHDRLLLYTDGLTEPENEHGESFGDRQLELAVRTHAQLPAPGLAQVLFSAARRWQRPSLPQQDDITFVLMDIL